MASLKNKKAAKYPLGDVVNEYVLLKKKIELLTKKLEIAKTAIKEFHEENPGVLPESSSFVITFKTIEKKEYTVRAQTITRIDWSEK